MNNATILLIDDDEITLELLKHIVEELTEGNVEAFTEGGSACDFIDSATPGEVGLVISDLQMPGVSGLDVLEVFRKQDKHTPFVMLTGNATREAVLEARRLGATAFVAKPFVASDLSNKVNNLLNAG